MPTYELTGIVTLKAKIVMEAEDQEAAWSELEFRLRSKLYLAGYSPEHDTSGTEIKSTDLAIGRIA